MLGRYYVENKLGEGGMGSVYAAMHADIMAGRPLELEALNGAVVRAGQMANVPTPINDVIYAALKPYEHGNFDNPDAPT